MRLREVYLSFEILGDPTKRTYVDTRLETDRKRKEKYAQSDKNQSEEARKSSLPVEGE